MKRQTMRKLFYLSAFILGGCIISNGSGKGDYTKLPPEGKTFDVKPFKAIKANGIFSITLSQGSKEGVIVKGDLPKDLKVTNIGDTLVIEDTAHTHFSNMNVSTDIYITLTDINYFENSSVGKTQCSDTLHLKKLTFQTEGVGTTNLLLNADTVKGDQDGVGTLTLLGKARFTELSDNGVGTLDSYEFHTEVLHVSANGVGAAAVYASRELYMQANGVGGIKYHGPAEVKQAENNGVGSIRHVNN